MAKMAHLQITPKEEKAEGEPAPAGPSYPTGAMIHLGGEEMEKLGLSDMPKVGQKFNLQGMGHVASAHSAQGAGGEANQGFSLQLTHLGVSPEMQSAANKLYGQAKERVAENRGDMGGRKK